MKIKKKWLISGLIILTSFIGVYLLILTAPRQPAVEPVERTWLIETETIHPQQLSPSLILYGTVETPDLLSSAAPAQGYVLEVLVREGTAIEEGQRLLTLDPRDYEPRVRQYEADVAELEAEIVSEKLRYASDQKTYAFQQEQIKLGEAEVERAEMLKKRNMGSTAALDEARESLNQTSIDLTMKKLDIDDHQARLNQLVARVNRAKAELELARLDLERSRVTAPFAGFISEIDVSAGDAVSENQFLMSFYPSKTLEIRATIPAQYQLEIQQAMAENGSLEGTALLGKTTLPLNLKRLAGSADTRGIDGLFEVVSGHQSLRIGSALSLYLKRPPIKNTVALPYSALYGSSLVYRLEQGRLHSVTVNKMGEFIDEKGQSKVLLYSDAFTNGDKIVITHLPNAISGLKAEEITSQHQTEQEPNS